MHPAQAIGIPELDAQHAEISELVDSLQRLIAAADPQGLVPRTLKRLRQLLATHFEYEESLMQMVSYPELPQHARMHGRVLQLFDDYFAQRPAAGDDDGCADLIGDKVIGHVLDHDRHLIAMVRDYMKTFRSAPDT
jgi:hemerythrin-like metal-binding protein